MQQYLIAVKSSPLFKIAYVSLLAWFAGDAFGGLGTGIIAALIGGTVAIIIESIRGLVAAKSEKTKLLQVVADERDHLIDRSDEIYEREKQFLLSQIQYKDKLEHIARQRAHRALAEVQRCNAYIYTLQMDLTSRGHVFKEFVVKSYEDIVGEVDLPDPPAAPIMRQ